MDDERLDVQVADAIRTRLIHEIVTERQREQRGPHRQRAAGRRPAWVPVLASAMVVLAVIAVSITVLLSVRAPEPAVPHPRSAQVFAGDCGAVLTRAEAGRAVGGRVAGPDDVTRSQAAGMGAGNGSAVAALLIVGGLQCGWSGTAGSRDGSGLALAVAPVGLAPKKATKPYCYGSGDGGPQQTTCTFSLRSAGIWFSGRLTIAKGGEQAARGRLPGLGAQLVRAAADPAAAVPLPKAPAGSWARGVDCAALTRAAGLARALHTPGLRGGSGNGSAEPTEGQLVAEQRIGATPCLLEAPEHAKGWRIQGLGFKVFPGGGAALARPVDAQADGKPVRLASGQVVTVTTDATGVRIIHVIDGVNYLQLIPGLHESLTHSLAAVEPLLQQLDRR